MPLFDGVPFIVETPEQSMRADRPAVRNYLSALQSGMALKQRRDEAAQESAYRESVLKQRQSEFEAEAPTRNLQREAEMARIQSYIAARKVEELKQQAIIDKAKAVSEDAPFMQDFQNKLVSTRTLEDLLAVPVPTFKDPDNNLAAKEMYRQHRMGLEFMAKREADADLLDQRLKGQLDLAVKKMALEPDQLLMLEEELKTIDAGVASMEHSMKDALELKREAYKRYGIRLPGSSKDISPNATSEWSTEDFDSWMKNR